MASFVASNTADFTSSGTVTPIFFIDNAQGTKTVRINRLLIVGTHNPLDGHRVTVRGNRTLGTLARADALTPQGRFTDASDQPDMKGCLIYEWDGTSTGMGGFSGGTVLDVKYITSAPSCQLGGFILKPGDNLAIQCVGVSAGTTIAHIRCFGTVDL